MDRDSVWVVSGYVPPLRPYQSNVYQVSSLALHGDHDYSRLVSHFWNGGIPFINLEHDMEVDDERIQTLLDCNHPNCTWAYRIHRVHNIHRTLGHIGQLDQPSIYCQSEWVVDGNGTKFQPIGAGTETCSHTGIGFCKITPVRAPINRCHWTQVESEINHHIRTWHVHWPEVNHYHK